jgi:hypothetical protein
LISAFKESHDEFIKEETNPAVVYKMLLIGLKVAQMFEKTSVVE